MTCVLIWLLHYREGLAWDGGPAEFNWHPLLILIGFIFLQGMGTAFLRSVLSIAYTFFKYIIYYIFFFYTNITLFPFCSMICTSHDLKMKMIIGTIVSYTHTHTLAVNSITSIVNMCLIISDVFSFSYYCIPPAMDLEMQQTDDEVCPRRPSSAGFHVRRYRLCSRV